MNEGHQTNPGPRAVAARMLLRARRGDEAARQRLIDLAVTESSAAWAFDVLLGLEIAEAERTGALPELPAGLRARVLAVVRTVAQDR